MVNALDLRCGGTSLESRFERFPDFILFFGTHKLKGNKGVWGDFRIGASSPQFSLCHTAIGEATTLLSDTLRCDKGDVHENFAEK